MADLILQDVSAATESRVMSLGIDVGGSSVKLAAVRDGQVLWESQTPTYSKPTKQQLAEVIRTTVAGRFEKGGAVGICVPGTRDRVTRAVIQSVNLPALNGLKLDELVGDSVGAEVVHIEICTDAVATAYDLYATRKLKGRLLGIALGTGVGMAVLDGGVSLMVHGESPGHIGQIDVSIEGDPVIGPDGGAGSLEGYVGSPALVKKYGPDMTANLKRLGRDDSAIKALARAIRICHGIYVPDHVGLAGGIGIRIKHLLPVIKELVNKDLTSVACRDWTLFCGDDEFHAAKGAAKLAADRFAESPIRKK